MTTLETVLRSIREISKQARDPGFDEMLFESGFLDSFALPDLVSILETQFSIRIRDEDLRPANFASVRKIEAYLRAQGI